MFTMLKSGPCLWYLSDTSTEVRIDLSEDLLMKSAV